VILQPADFRRRNFSDPRLALPENLRKSVLWKVHDATDSKGIAYLASTSGGERIYLARELVEADLVVPLFTVGFDPVVGLHSPGSLLYPGMSNADAFAKTRGEGHRELRPENDRPLRQLVEEICWLLGVQFAIGSLPSRLPDQASAIFAGQFESVQRYARQALNQSWRLQLDRRAETVVVAIGDPEATVGWNEIGSALALAESLVVRDGRIILLTSLSAQPGPGLDVLKASRSPKAALAQLRKEHPPDLVSSLQVASAASWARVSLLSRLDSALVDDLQLNAVDSLAEAERLIHQSDDVVLIDGANRMWGEIVAG
jgi:nickel-dependent lactate racemase